MINKCVLNGKIASVIFITAIVIIISGCSKDDNPESTKQAPSFRDLNQDLIHPQSARYTVFDNLLSTMDTISALDSVLKLFLTDPNVEKGYAGEQGIAIVYKNGIRGGIFIDPLDHPEIGDDDLKIPVPEQKNTGDRVTPKKTIPKSKKTLFLNPSYWERTKFADKIISNYNKNLPKIGFEQHVFFKNEEVTLEKFTGLEEYAIIHIYSHGMAWPHKDSIADVYLLTGQDFTEAVYNKYKQDIMNEDIVIMHSKDEVYVFIRPEFILAKNDFKNSDQIIYGGFCYSSLGKWPEKLTGTGGVSGYFGFDWSVYTSWNAKWNRKLIESLTNTSVVLANSAADWMNDDMPKFYWNKFDKKNVNIEYSGLTDLVLFDMKDIELNYTKCNLNFRVNGYYDFYESMSGNDTSYSNWSDTRITNYKFDGSFTGNTFTGEYYRQDGGTIHDYDITITLGSSQDEILSLTYKQRISTDQQVNNKFDIAAKSIPLISTDASSNKAKYGIEGIQSCNSITSISRYIKSENLTVPFTSIRTLTDYECTELSHIFIDFE